MSIGTTLRVIPYKNISHGSGAHAPATTNLQLEMKERKATLTEKSEVRDRREVCIHELLHTDPAEVCEAVFCARICRLRDHASDARQSGPTRQCSPGLVRCSLSPRWGLLAKWLIIGRHDIRTKQNSAHEGTAALQQRYTKARTTPHITPTSMEVDSYRC